MSNSFYITNLARPNKGPWVFANRLQKALISMGLTYSTDSVNQMSIISGPTQPDKFNILRLDGLYFQRGGKNRGIFNSYKAHDHIVFQGDFCKAQYEAFTGIEKPNTIIRNGVDKSFFEKAKDTITTNNPVVIACSKWRRHKRLPEIIEAFTSPKLRNIELWVINGKGFNGQTTENIKLLGTKPASSLPGLLQSATAMIHLSWLDWCPNSVVEGLACGLPVLCSHNGGTKELVKNDGVVIQLEEDYKIGSTLNLYNPPEIDTDIIVNGVLELVEMPKIKTREDLKISNVALQYKSIFK